MANSLVIVPKAGEMVASQLRKQIVTGVLKEGDFLSPEAVLMEQFGVSRPTLREAFRILEAERLIQVRRGSHGGARVKLPDSASAGRYVGTLLQYHGTTLSDVLEARAWIETTAVALLATRRSKADLQRLDKFLAQGEPLAEQGAGYERHDIALQRLLVELTGNQTMRVLLDVLLSIVERHHEWFLREHRDAATDPANAQLAQRAHVQLVEFIRQKDSDSAVALMRKYLEREALFTMRDPGETVLDVLE